MAAGDEERPADLAETFAEVARSMRAEGSVEATMDRIVKLAVQTIDGCDHAGISFVQGRTITTPAASDDVPVRVDAVQYEAHEGPCLDAIREREVFTTDDLRRERRWPHFSARAVAESGVLSMLCFRLFVEENTLGALNLYSRTEAAFDADDWTVGSVFAAHAAVALSAAIKQQQLEEAVESRDVIGQAKGILMAREHVTADEAFDMLRRGSQRLNVKLRELAGKIATGDDASTETEPGRR